MKTTCNLHRYFWLISIAFLVSCETHLSVPTGGASSVTIIAVPTKALVLPSPTPLPTLTLLPTGIPLASRSTPSELFNLDNIRMAYVADGNLYLQDGSHPPELLTHSGVDSEPIISDDGVKIVFSRGKASDKNIYSINADGSNEQALITNQWPAKLGDGTKAGHLAFVPGTYQVLFNTYSCDSKEVPGVGCTTGLFIVDAKTTKIKKFLAPSLGGFLPFKGASPFDGNYFKVSPDQKLLSIALSGHIDLFSLDGQIVRDNILTYTRSTPLELLPSQYWLPDSSGLIAALPAETKFGGAYETTPTYAIWRYKLDSSMAIQIPLSPPPIWFSMDCDTLIHVSPDRNWVVYNGATENDILLYVGNLNDGHSIPYAMNANCPETSWSPDNLHFVYKGSGSEHFLGTIGQSPLSIGIVEFKGWIDPKHFIYSPAIDGRGEIFVGEIDGETIHSYKSGITLSRIFDSFTFVVLDPKSNH